MLTVACTGTKRCSSKERAPVPAPAPSAVVHGERVTRHIVIDQFGYLPDAAKVAVLVRPPAAEDGADGYVPGRELEVRRVDGALVFSGPSVPWHDGAVDIMSGDSCAWFDFSSVTAPGTYVVRDPVANAESFRFEVGADVYRGVLRAAVRMFYFNRANEPKRAPFACVKGRCWTLGESYVGKRQDTEARSIRAQDDPSTARDLSGGWWDAGDVNKYVLNACTPVHQLLTAFAEHPAPFGDDFGIPESGNGVPDLLDEIGVEVRFLEKMQPDDLGGGVLLKVGNVSYGDPVPDDSRLPRYYPPEPCSSATVAAAGAFAHAALVFQSVPALAAWSSRLRERAVRAWNHFQTHPRTTSCDDGTILAPGHDPSLEKQAQAAVVASAYLFALTGDARYAEAFRAGYRSTHPFTNDDWSSYEAEQGDALLFYTTLPNADASIRADILERHAQIVGSSDVFDVHLERDPYRAYVRRASYHWGSSRVFADVGNANEDLLVYHLGAPGEAAARQERAIGLVHHFHGVNAMQLVYLTNMEPYGATRSASEMFHAWFRDGDPKWDSAKSSELGPAPGYVTGGPNAAYCEDQDPARARCATSALRHAPPGKAYRDFNTGYDPKLEYDRSWELTEPAIYYQAAYVKLLSAFVPR